MYNPDKWAEYSDYYTYDVPQRDPSWLLVKIGRPSGSTLGYCLGHSTFNTPEEAALDICCMRYNILPDGSIDSKIPIILGKKIKSEESKRIMGLGTDTEPIAREWYANETKTLCEEVGYCVPKFDQRLGVSIDGDVKNLDGPPTDGMIEIKCPEHMYKPIKEHLANESFSKKYTAIQLPDKPLKEYKKDYNDYYYYIWQTHYDQMQMGMAIMNKKWCDYIVYALDGDRYIERIYFDKIYWGILYEEIDKFIKEKVDSLLGYLNIIELKDIILHGLNINSIPESQKLTFPLMPK